MIHDGLARVGFATCDVFIAEAGIVRVEQPAAAMITLMGALYCLAAKATALLVLHGVSMPTSSSIHQRQCALMSADSLMRCP